jgi:hypothetical protein
MPLSKGKSKKTIGRNISEMESSGYSRAQSIAASLNEARKSGARIPKPKHHGEIKVKESKKEHKKEHHKKEDGHHKEHMAKMKEHHKHMKSHMKHLDGMMKKKK